MTKFQQLLLVMIIAMVAGFLPITALGHAAPVPQDCPEDLIKALQSGNDIKMWNGFEEVIHRPCLGALKPLISILRESQNGYYRKKAAQALGKIKSPEALEPLLEALQHDKEFDVRRDAAEALGEIGDSSAVNPLISALARDGDSAVRSYSARALGKIGAPKAIEPLIIAFGKEGPYVRDEVILALGNFDDQRVVEPLRSALRDEESRVRRNAIIALKQLGEMGVEPLIEIINDKQAYARMDAAYALGEIQNNRASQTLLKALKKKDLEIIAGAYAFFIRHGKSGTEDRLIEALNKYGVGRMAGAFSECGNSQLKAAAWNWAHREGYNGLPIPDPCPKWGKK